MRPKMQLLPWGSGCPGTRRGRMDPSARGLTRRASSCPAIWVPRARRESRWSWPLCGACSHAISARSVRLVSMSLSSSWSSAPFRLLVDPILRDRRNRPPVCARLKKEGQRLIPKQVRPVRPVRRGTWALAQRFRSARCPRRSGALRELLLCVRFMPVFLRQSHPVRGFGCCRRAEPVFVSLS